MAERVYIETTVVSYLTARPNRDVVIAGHQQITHEWWDTRRESYELWRGRKRDAALFQAAKKQ